MRAGAGGLALRPRLGSAHVERGRIDHRYCGPRPHHRRLAVIFIVVKFTVRPEYAEGWLDLVADFTTSTRAEPGNVFFEWSRSVDDPHVYVLTEGFHND